LAVNATNAGDGQFVGGNSAADVNTNKEIQRKGTPTPDCSIRGKKGENFTALGFVKSPVPAIGHIHEDVAGEGRPKDEDCLLREQDPDPDAGM
jgi:hypothetical protein